MITTLFIFLTTLSTGLSDLFLGSDESAIVYYTPKNSVAVHFTYTIETQEMGRYAQFAEELLGIKDVMTETRTIYTLENVSIGSRSEVDLNRPHKVIPQGNIPTHLLTINEKGLLQGFNMASQEKVTKSKKEVKSTKDKIIPICTYPFTEDILASQSLAAQAEALAQQIFHLREVRLYLLSGEMEHAPSDGDAMVHVLNELAAEEEKLMALFVGKKNVTTKRYTYMFTPIKSDDKSFNHTLYFSKENGFTSAENIDAEHIIVEADYQYIYRNDPPVENKKSRKKKKDDQQVLPSQLEYNIPGNACVRVLYKGELMQQKTLPIAQFGMDVALPTSIFTGTELPSIIFSEKTGNIISISK